jgi:hypothetical protein
MSCSTTLQNGKKGDIHFQVPYVFLVLAHHRPRILHFHVTAYPTAEWTEQQLQEAFSFEQLPRSLLRSAIVSSAMTTENKRSIWACAKFYLRRARLGREPMWNE